jgi:hypothetical protein
MLFRFPVVVCMLAFGFAAAAQESANLPQFSFYKMRTGEGLVSLVVPPSVTDKKLEALVLFIRRKVQEGKFADLGIRHPTEKRFGKLGYGAGIVAIYRGAKCANEQFTMPLRTSGAWMATPRKIAARFASRMEICGNFSEATRSEGRTYPEQGLIIGGL